jgi:hypothetical protein
MDLEWKRNSSDDLRNILFFYLRCGIMTCCGLIYFSFFYVAYFSDILMLICGWDVRGKEDECC